MIVSTDIECFKTLQDKERQQLLLELMWALSRKVDLCYKAEDELLKTTQKLENL